MVDELDRTARQVRLDGRNDSPVHDVAGIFRDSGAGSSYPTVCQRVLSKAEGAILTTREVTCGLCMRGGR